MKTKLVKGSKYQVKVDIDFFGNKPIECPICKKKEYYRITSKKVAEELALIYYACLNCGFEDSDVFD